ncbi:hypothetical protein PF008_g15783 [Phytophthora fragariae]|uniref:Uncharacterized protein n=1 Tax=Phytophthora fragariae TaxID=53985 RepID=A0A6G0REE9_9STRA|nr:hypothetical protein PF008_g15783 [Phytophthora fragariae]
MASHGSGGDSDSYSDGPESGYMDAFVSEVFVGDANPGEGGRPLLLQLRRLELLRRDEAPCGTCLAGPWAAPATPVEDKAKVLSDTVVMRKLRVQVIKEGLRLVSKACPCPTHKVVKAQNFEHKGTVEGTTSQDKEVDYPIKDKVDIKTLAGDNLHRASVNPNNGVQVKTEQLQSQGQSSPPSGQGQGQPTQSGQGQQGLGGYGPQLSDPYQGQPYGLSSQSTQQANPFAAGASSTPAPTTQYNSPYGGPAYGVTTSAAPSIKMPQTAIASYGGISVANLQRAGFGFADPFSQPAGQVPPVLPAPQQSQQPAWTGPTQPSPQSQAWQGQGGATVNSPSSVKVEPPQSSRSSSAG